MQGTLDKIQTHFSLSLRQVKLMRGKMGKRERRHHLLHFVLVFGQWVWRSDFRERNPNFSLKSKTFGPSFLVGARGKAALLFRGFVGVLESGVSEKLHR